MSSVVELVQRFAHLRATDEARQVVQTALAAITLPPNHSLANAAPLGQGIDALITLAQIRSGMDVNRLGFRIPGWEAQCYTAAYLKAFLAAVRQELLAYLCAEALPLLPLPSQEMAQATVESLEKALQVVVAGESTLEE